MSSFSTLLSLFLKENFDLIPSNLDLFLSAFTHSSYSSDVNYERLEFLGDSCISLVIAEQLFKTKKSLKDISTLKKQIICGRSLAFSAKKLQLDKYIRRGKGLTELSDSIIEDLYESFIGAVYLDFGFCRAKSLVIDSLWNNYLNKELIFSTDYKTILQEIVQNKCRDSVTYKLVATHNSEESGQMFEVGVCWLGGVKAKAFGKKMKEAEQKAAKRALDRYFYEFFK